jgi:hypothetical protein
MYACCTSYLCGAHGLNLHVACSRLVLLEPPQSLNTMFQAVGRVHRLGQGEPQKVWSLFQEHSIWRWWECNNVTKALPELAAQLHDLLQPRLVTARSRAADAALAEEHNMEEADPGMASLISG